ncbi:hypothetical protein A2783_05755 [Microgenomates group bacterium RIFCSPHIGHO2_01_FULL_45_11]|nr:MAG: hypothetical protein A2783_05755 [Microgenomates group bacterium RIFCSPHIGHO2_01_FULL_45_11]
MINEKEEVFLREIEERLAENRRLAERSILPPFLYSVASYLGFHAFRVLFLTSFLVTTVVFWLWFEWLMSLSKQIFFY